LNNQVIIERRTVLERKITQAFNDKISDLSSELQRILIDDMVTAFENRLKVLKSVNFPNRFWVELMELNVDLYYIKALYSNMEYEKKRGL